MSQQFVLTCSCGTEILVRASQAGGTVSCQCGQSVSIPTLRDLRQLPVAAAATNPAARASSWQLFNGVLFACGVPIALLCLVTFVYAMSQRMQLNLTKPDFRAFVYNQDIDSLSLSDCWHGWLFFRDMPLANRPTPDYLLNRRTAFRLLMWMIGSGLGFALGVGCIVTALSLGRRARQR